MNAQEEARNIFNAQLHSQSNNPEKAKIYTPKEKQEGQNTGNSQPQNQDNNKEHEQNAMSKFTSIVRKFDTETPIKRREFIGGIFPRGYLSIIGGAAGIGKSWFVDKFVGDLSIGGDIFGGVGYEARPRKSLVLAGELGADGMIERAQAANIEVNLENAFIVDQLDAEEKDITLTLNSPKGKDNITELVQLLNPDILFVDSLISFFDGDENKISEIADALKFLLKLARTQNIAVVAIHHIRKRLSNEQTKPLVLDDVIGSSAINRLTAVVVGMEYNRDIEAVKVSCLKSWFKHFKSFSYKVKSNFYNNGVDIDINTDLKEEATLNPTKKATQPDIKTAIILFLKGRGDTGANIQEISKGIEKERSSVKTILSRMYNDNEITRIKRGTYAINDTQNTEQTEIASDTEQDYDDIEIPFEIESNKQK